MCLYVCMYLCTNSKCCCCGSAIHGAQMVSHVVQLKYILLISYTGNSSRKTSLLYSQRFLTFLVCPIEEPCWFWTFHSNQFFFLRVPTKVPTRGTLWRVLDHIRGKSCVLSTRYTHLLPCPGFLFPMCFHSWTMKISLYFFFFSLHVIVSVFACYN